MDLIDFPYERDEKFYEYADMFNLSEKDNAYLLLKLDYKNDFVNFKRRELELQYFKYLNKKEKFESLKHDSRIEELYKIENNVLLFNSEKFLRLAKDLCFLMENLEILYEKATQFPKSHALHDKWYKIKIDGCLEAGCILSMVLCDSTIVTVKCAFYENEKLYQIEVPPSDVMVQTHNDFIEWVSKNVEQLGFRKPKSEKEIILMNS